MLEALEDRLSPAGVLNLQDAPVGVFPQFQFIDPHPNAVGTFGATVLTLSTGNVVITDPTDDAGGTNAGAVYLFNGLTGELISTLTGSTAGDMVGGTTSGGSVVALASGNFLVVSPFWDNAGATNAGAVTFGNGNTGVNGPISAANSLVGTSSGDQVGSGATPGQGLVLLTNGNYAVVSPFWTNTATGATFAGAVTFGSGTSGVQGVISDTNSLIGTSALDLVGVGDQTSFRGVTPLANGNYVVNSNRWNNTTAGASRAGAVTWVDGTTGQSMTGFGAVSASNSMVGSADDDRVGLLGVTALANSNFVVSSPFWNDGAVSRVGAATFGHGTTGTSGAVSTTNSLVGSSTDDQIGSTVFALSNGNYVAGGSSWRNVAAGAAFAGALALVDGTTGQSATGFGLLTAANSIVGTSPNDRVGNGGLFELGNGNYVIVSPEWRNAGVLNAGAVTWVDGTTGLGANGLGAVSTGNSLVGSSTDDFVGRDGVTVLTNHNYVVASAMWDNTVTDAGAATWMNGVSGQSSTGFGAVTDSNSLVGSTAFDQVGFFGVTALATGNYVVINPAWDNGGLADAGAVTFGDGTTGISGTVSAANSLVGSTDSNFVGLGGVTPLVNGNYVVASPLWVNGGAFSAGAVTFGDGVNGIIGAVSAANSLVGSTTGDQVGTEGVTALANGNYVVISSSRTNGGAF
ncbi:MAG: hypothetical protein AB7K24_28200, partial [Gemmataceae bacterium]